MSGLTDHVRLFKLGLPLRAQVYARELVMAHLATGLDPLLIAAVMDRESLCGEALKPRGAGGTGDQGHGRGLMQIDDRSHGPFIAATDDSGIPLWTKAASNILYGAQLLEKNLREFEMEEDAALAAYNAGRGRVRRALMTLGATHTLPDRRKCLDLITTGHDYVSNVLARRRNFIPPAAP